jgi:type I restriction enzyme S subunit
MSETLEKTGLLPKLRFPGFRGEWAHSSIGSEGKIHKGRGISKADIHPDGNTPCIRYGELYTTYGEIINEPISKTNLPMAELFFSEAGDVIVPSSGETKEDIATASCVLRSQIALGGDLNVLRSKNDGRWLSYYINGKLRSDIAKVAQGNSVVHLYPDQIARVSLGVPSEAEQGKIADCLQSLDGVIAAEREKLGALKRYKKGLLQQLFPAEGETIPRLRFPQFRNSAGWAWRKLDGVIGIITPPAKLQTFAYQPTGQFPIIDQSAKSIAGWTNDASLLVKEPLPLIVFGDHTCTLKLAERPFAQGADGIKIIRSASPNVLTSFLFFALQLNPVTMQEYRRHYSLLTEKEVPITQDQEEQSVVADTFFVIQEEIQETADLVSNLRTHKAALMQQLFPSLDEIEG